MSMVDAHLEIEPEDVIEFTLVDQSTSTSTTNSTTNNSTNGTPSNNSTTATATTTSQKVTLTLKNPDADGLPIAFKVRLFFSCRCVWFFFFLLHTYRRCYYCLQIIYIITHSHIRSCCCTRQLRLCAQ